jgi:hydroxymethylbilane synthase
MRGLSLKIGAAATSRVRGGKLPLTAGLLAPLAAAHRLAHLAGVPANGTHALQSTEIRIGTRGSRLALVQAELVRQHLAEALGGSAPEMAILPLKTSGDRITDRPLSEAGGKGLFTKEIDEALLDGRVDVGVHSAKDMATRLPDGIVIAACLERVDVRDVLIAGPVRRIVDLPQGARLGTSSLRRRALALRLRPDLSMVDLRGNVETRLRRIEEGVADATVLASAGLTRLGLIDLAAGFLDADEWIPAPGQGTIAIACRADDAVMRERLAMIDHAETSLALAVERAFLARLDGSCRTPIGGYARLAGGHLSFSGIIVKPDGSVAHAVRLDGPADKPESLGSEAGGRLAELGGANFFQGG